MKITLKKICSHRRLYDIYVGGEKANARLVHSNVGGDRYFWKLAFRDSPEELYKLYTFEVWNKKQEALDAFERIYQR